MSIKVCFGGRVLANVVECECGDESDVCCWTGVEQLFIQLLVHEYGMLDKRDRYGIPSLSSASPR
jgi:hypothetical protein